jgi:uncharacterized protein (TIGR02145 family)
MKTTMHYLKLTICIFMIMLIFSVLSLQAQDYMISFAGTGASTTVDSVKIENLTQGTKLKMKGSDVLHLMGTTGIETITGDEDGKISIYPNPMKDFAKMQFDLPESGETLITLYEITGRIIVQIRDFLSTGNHTFGIQGIKEGIYFVRVNTGKYSSAGRLISSGSQTTGTKITYENNIALQEKQNDSKGTNEEKVMQYTTGDVLKLTGISGSFRTVIADVPLASKTINFSFIPCTDADGNNYPVVIIGTVKGTADNSILTEDKGGMIFMGENLKVTKLNDNTPIFWVTDPTLWSQMESPAFSWYLNSVSYKDTFGAYYNWYAVNTGKLCPTGWHVPTRDAFVYLSEILGGWEEAGGKLKETGTVHWKSPNVGARNTTGFTALPAGYRDSNGSFPAMGSYGMWWSSSPAYVSCSTGAWYVYLYYNDKEFMPGEKCLSTTGYSVRCLKD